jgi:hypothetical protein
MNFRIKEMALFVAMASCCLATADELKIPANTGYSEPDPDGIRISGRNGVSRWNDDQQSLNWFGDFKATGDVKVLIDFETSTAEPVTFHLEFAGETRCRTVEDTAQSLDFGDFKINAAGYQRLKLTWSSATAKTAPSPASISLSGDAVKGAHFNLDPRRNAASVHLSYPVPQGKKVEAFYVEMTGLEDPVWSYYMACGWHRGYFGMQVNSPTERRIIFSVWDSGNEAIDRDKVKKEDRVNLVAKGEGVYTGDFGNEGTGGHSHWKYPWKTGEKQRFVVTAEPSDETHTIYSGYYFHPEKKEWKLISSWNAPKEGGYMRGLYSFSENFVGSNGQLVRKALYGRQWIRTSEGELIEITEARFSHDPTGRENRLDRYMGVENGEFFLSHGGFTSDSTPYRTPFQRPATQAPEVLSRETVLNE